MTEATVERVHLSRVHEFSKQAVDQVELQAGLGVVGDAHQGAAVQHRSRVAVDPSQPNLRQVHLIAGELHDELAAKGFKVQPGDLGENITTRGIDLHALPTGSLLKLGAGNALVCLTGLRNPCPQIEAFSTGLLAQVVERQPDGSVRRKAGVMGVVIHGGNVASGDQVTVSLPPEPHLTLERV